MSGTVLEKRGKVFAVASAKGGVGKSVFAVNFAIALMRETKARVILLDFDDAYQYAVAERYDLTIVSFDHDFDQTKKGRVLPKDLFHQK